MDIRLSKVNDLIAAFKAGKGVESIASRSPV